MATYGVTPYSGGTYGRDVTAPLPAKYRVDPFTAAPADYRTVMVTWAAPETASGAPMYRYRLLGNRYGFPVDETDGSVLVDSADWPGNAYADQDVIAGTYRYYGFYIQSSESPEAWSRAGLTACLVPQDHGSGALLESLLPQYARDLPSGTLTGAGTRNPDLARFLSVAGWGLDYLRTQQGMIAGHVNDPSAMSYEDLANLAAQLGMPFQAELPAWTLRKAVADWAHACTERGTPGGISSESALLSGWDLDLQTGPNLLLDDDQSRPLAPAYPAWSTQVSYTAGEKVTYDTYIYQCTAGGGEGQSPTGNNTSTAYWKPVVDADDTTGALANPATAGGLGTWEAIYPGQAASYAAPAGTLTEGIGVLDPSPGSTGTNHLHNSVRVYNKTSTPQDVEARTLSREPADVTAANTALAPDPLRVIKDGVPIPYADPGASAWQPGTRYRPGDIVSSGGLPYLAARASTGAPPPAYGTPLNAETGFEDGPGPWAVAQPVPAGLTATAAVSTAQAYHGTQSLRIQFSGTSGAYAASAAASVSSEPVPVVPGALYKYSAWVYSASSGATARLFASTADPFGSSAATATSTTVTLTQGTWTYLSGSVTAQPNAATVTFGVQPVAPSANTSAFSWTLYADLAVITCAQTPEWSLLGTDARARLMLSAYVSQSLTATGNPALPVTPYAEWYDQHGQMIARVTARTATAGTAGTPAGYAFDGFGNAPGTVLAGRALDAGGGTWTVPAGSWLLDAAGHAYPYPSGPALAVTSLPGVASVAVTLATGPAAGQDQGLLIRYTDPSNYWLVGRAGLWKNNGGTWTQAAAYGTAARDGDRLQATLSGNTITVYVNGTQAATVTDSFNATATSHGIAAVAS